MLEGSLLHGFKGDPYNALKVCGGGSSTSFYSTTYILEAALFFTLT